ncbi:hypothetical protein Cci01nite_52350 [Catellatospora citrea]|uniref:Uncharacterized protein n=1 Tax=Catellatospora citrea TaxID=53366 RepID=A0A8J3KHI2_9ACTN|nr:hypothetical protein Cci01nite_52350 [Catellatospora citrea]
MPGFRQADLGLMDQARGEVNVATVKRALQKIRDIGAYTRACFVMCADRSDEHPYWTDLHLAR